MANFVKFGIPFLLIFGAFSFFLSSSVGDVSFELKDRKECTLIARKFRGLAGSQEFAALLDEISKMNKAGTLKGTFAVLYSQNPDVLLDTISILVGSISERGSIYSEKAQLPDSLFSTIPLPSAKVAEATVNAQEMFTPGPSEVNKRLEKFARENQLELMPAILEQYLPDGRIITTRDVKD